MPWDCPKCGTVNEPEAQHGDCGYDRVARAVDPSRVPPPRPPGFLATYRYLRWCVGAIGIAVFGLIWVGWELSEDVVDPWGVVQGGLIGLLGFALFGILIRNWSRRS